MARFLCGVMGDAWGHVHEALALTEALRGHEFLFVGGGRALELDRTGFAVHEVPVPGTVYADNRVDALATLRRALVAAVIREFETDLVLSLYEIVTAVAARRAGVPCYSLDHQHLLTHCSFGRPPGQAGSRWGLSLSMRLLYSWPRSYLVHSFFPVTPLLPDRTEVFAPLLSPRLEEIAPTRGDHVVIYQTSPTFRALVPALARLSGPCRCYGFGERPPAGAVTFHRFSRERFLADLSSCRYLVANGSHTVLSEALHLGKPVLAFPIAGAYEQFVNARMLRELGYGDCSLASDPGPELFELFEQRLPEYESRLTGGEFHGTARLAARLEQLADRNRSDRLQSPPRRQ
ncbi:MAG: hypothetical protein HY815_04915 [Candidatus Riflebacteria bacterium]|nr:hypothetical protein [Candidatus Riflebacteria bacterium]